MAEGFFIEHKRQIDHLLSRVTEIVEAGNVVSLSLLVGRTRSSRQQAALEVWCRQVADLLNESGIPRAIHSPIYKNGEMESSWTQASVKSELWRPMQMAIVNIESSAEAKTTDYPKVYDELVKWFGNKGVSVPRWPVRLERGD
jgi:hypothetical protein